MDLQVKDCLSCAEALPLNAFGTYTSRGTTYHRTICKYCRNANEKNQRDDHTRWLDRKRYKLKKESNPQEVSDYYRDWHLRKKYNLTLEEFTLLSESQNNLCAICENPEKSHKNLVVDHNHNTGEVRGLICSSCNKALGHAKDSKALLEKMITYLDERGSYADE
jgi:hypothetical protein